MLSGSSSAGAVVSTTVTLNVPLVQVTVVTPRGNVEPETGAQEEPCVGRPFSSSAPLPGTVNATTAPFGPVASRVMSGRTGGGCCSSTVTVKLPVAELLRESDDVHCTVVVPVAKVLPEEGEQLTETLPSTRSCAFASYVTTAPEPLPGTLKSRGILSDGAVVSTTFTLNEPPSHCTVVSPRGNFEPEAGLQFADVVGRPFSSSSP